MAVNITAADYKNLPQLIESKKLVQEKIKNTQDPQTKTKLQNILLRYNKCEKIINQYYNVGIVKEPATFAGKRNVITALDVYQNKYKLDGYNEKEVNEKVKDEAPGYGFWDGVKDFKKTALGVGSVVAGYGLINGITVGITSGASFTTAAAAVAAGEAEATFMSTVAGKGILTVLGEAIKLIPGLNAITITALVAGGTILAASKLLPWIKRKINKIQSQRASVSEATNDLNDTQLGNKPGFGDEDLQNENFATKKSTIVQALYDYPALINEYKDRLYDSSLTNTQKDNLQEAINEAEAKLRARGRGGYTGATATGAAPATDAAPATGATATGVSEATKQFYSIVKNLSGRTSYKANDTGSIYSILKDIEKYDGKTLKIKVGNGTQSININNLSDLDEIKKLLDTIKTLKSKDYNKIKPGNEAKSISEILNNAKTNKDSDLSKFNELE